MRARSIFRETYDGSGKRADRPARRLPEPPRQRLRRHRLGMATNIPPHNAASSATRRSISSRTRAPAFETLVNFVPGPDLPTGGIIVETHASIVESYRTAAAASGPRPLGDRGAEARHLRDHRHRDSLPGAEVATDGGKSANWSRRNGCRWSPRSAMRSPEDVRIVHPSAEPRGRCSAPDGIALQADRPGDAHSAQPQRPLEGGGAARHGARRGFAPNGSPTGARC